MNFIDDENLVPIANRQNAKALNDDVANLLDLSMRCRIDFEHVDVAAFGNLDARIAHAAGLSRGPLHAVQGPCQDAGGCRLPDAPRSCEHERLRQPPAGDRVAKRTRDRLLPDDVVEPLGPPFARENLIGHSGELTVLGAWSLVLGPVRTGPRPGGPAAHCRIRLALLPAGPDAVHGMQLHRFRTAVQSARTARPPTGHRLNFTTRVRASRAAGTSPGPRRRQR